MTTANLNQTGPELPPDAPLHLEGKLRSADGKMATMIGYWDRNLRNRFCNLAYAQWFGRQPDAMPGTHLRDFIGEERYRINLPHIEAALAGEEQRFEVPAYTANGSLSWHGLVQYIPDFIDGQVQGVYIIVSDISAVKETEAAMRKNETLLRESQTAARIGSYINTLATGTIECTPVMDEIFGMTPDYPHTNQGWMDLIHPNWRQAVQDAFAESINNKTPFAAEFKIIRPSDGAERWMHGVAEIAQDDKGSVISLTGMVQDITNRKQTETAVRESEERYRTVFETSPDAVAINRLADGLYLDINRGFTHMTEWTPQEIIGRSSREINVWRDFGDRQRLLELLQRDGNCERMEADFVTKGGKVISAEMSAHVMSLGGVPCLLSITRDITERKAAEEAQRVAAIAFEAQQAMFITDAQKVILRVNKAFTEVTGYTAEESVGQTPSLLKSGRQDPAFYKTMWECISRTGTWQGEIWNRRKNGTVYAEHLSVSAVKNDAGMLTHYVGSFSDLTAYKAAEEQIHDLAFTDLLTGLPNRRHLIVRLQQAITAGESQKYQSALLILNLDNFKNLNSTLGRAQCDQILQHVAKRLNAAVGDGNTVAHVEGDQFAVILTDLNQHPQQMLRQVEAAAGKMLATINQPYQLAGSTILCTASVGITFFAAQYEETIEPLKRAELALQQAKIAGRNTLRFFDADMQAVVDARIALEAALRQAINNKYFVLYYQAQVSGSEGIVGVEALIRWIDPKRGMVSPVEFIPLAEETGLILPIGAWVLETACQQLAAWAAQPAMEHLSIAVNVSAQQFRESNFVEQVLATLERTGGNPRRLKLELTESVLIADAEDVIVKMNALKAIGIGFAIDDFGTGYSSLSYLKRLPLERLKIDQSFVRNILMDPDDAAISRAVIAMATSMGLGVIAEGVETEAQSDFLASLGCHNYQGYLFSKPLPVAEFEAFASRF
jgi:diguanylate cyclase (GGDEF)-like protein/PAS domain S-box-containing protein